MLLPILALLFGFVGLMSLKRGAIFVPTGRRAVRDLIDLLEVKPEDRAVDLGSGDGRIVIALARAGAEAHGFEHNPLLVWWSRQRIRKAGLSKRAFIHRANFWDTDFSSFTVFTVFGVDYIMKPLEEKIKKEARTGTRVVSYTFRFPVLKPSARRNGVYLYKI